MVWMDWGGLDFNKYTYMEIRTRDHGGVFVDEDRGLWRVRALDFGWVLEWHQDPKKIGEWLNSQGALFA